MGAVKVATCCYCGTKAALVLRGVNRHELSCASCGAPLHVMKCLPTSATEQSVPVAARVAAPVAPPIRPATKPVSRPGKRRKSKGLGRKVWSEVWDALEDIFD